MTMTCASLGTNVRLGTGHRCEGGRYGDLALRRSDPLVWTVVVDIAGLHRDAASHLYAPALGQKMDEQLIAALDRISDAIRSQSAGGMDVADLKASVTKLLQENGSTDISRKVAYIGSDLMKQIEGKGSELAKLVSDAGVARAAEKIESLKDVKDDVLREATKASDRGASVSSLIDAAATHVAKGDAADVVLKIADKGFDLLKQVALSEKGGSVSSLIDAGASALAGSMTNSYFLGGTPFDLLTWSAARVYHATATFVRLMLSPPRPTQ